VSTTTSYLASAHTPELQGKYAGIVSRAAAFVVDAIAIAAIFAIAGRIFEYVASIFLHDRVSLPEAGLGSRIALGVWAFIYLAEPLAMSGRTFGMAVFGLRAVRPDGRDVNGWHAVLRVLSFPLSFALAGLGFVLILVRRDRRALHDLIGSTVVVYAWDARAARLRFLVKR
jgi:uncharacterized RDD family membrane protein YckC